MKIKTTYALLVITVISLLLFNGCSVEKTVPQSESSSTQSSQSVQSSQSTQSSASSQSQQSTQSLASSESIQELATKPTTPKPSKDIITNEEFWREHYLAATFFSHGRLYNKGDVVNAHNGPLMYVAMRLCEDGMIGKYNVIDNNSAVMPFEDFLYYSEKYFGKECLPSLTGEDSEIASKIDKQAGTITLWMPDGYDKATDTYDYTAHAWVFSDMEFAEITEFSQDGLDKVKIVLNGFESSDKKEHKTIETKFFYWDTEVGYILESANWEYVKTNRVSLEGNIQKLDSLFDKKSDESYSYLSIGNMMYDIYKDNTVLKYSAINLENMLQTTGSIMHDFAGEEIFDWQSLAGNVYVKTNKAAYMFDSGLKLIGRKQIPKSVFDYLDKDGQLSYIVDYSLTKIAFYGEKGLYTCALEENATPILIEQHPHIPKDNDDVMNARHLYPITFTPLGNLFAGIGAWESTAGYMLYDSENTNNNQNIYLSASYGSSLIYDENGVLFLNTYNEIQSNTHYLSWDTNKLENAQWLGKNVENYETSSWITNNTVYFTQTIGDPNLPDKTVFLSADFKNKKMNNLPFTVNGAYAKILAAGENGKIIFWYGYMGETGFCVYTPN